MPIYEYRCGACGVEQEVIQSVNSAPLTDCPACGKSALKKLVSAAAFHLKGTGWYVTDFRDKDKKKSDTKDEQKSNVEGKDASKPAADKSESKADSKPDSSAKSKGSDSAASA